MNVCILFSLFSCFFFSFYIIWRRVKGGLSMLLFEKIEWINEFVCKKKENGFLKVEE